MPDRKRNPRKVSFLLDVIHLVIGGAVIVLSVLAFLSPEKHVIFFPLIFFLAALLALINGVHRLRTAGRDNNKKLRGILSLLTCLFLIAAAVVSAVVML